MSMMPYRGDDRGQPLDMEPEGSEFQVSATQFRAEIDSQIATAKRYPRSLDKVKKVAEFYATFDEEAASGCIYALPRGNKTIDGPSVRLAEIMVSAWGNCRVAARVTEIGSDTLTATGMALDLEQNSGSQIEVTIKITGKDGRRFNDDMVNMMGMKAISVAYRNAAFRMIPSAIVDAIYRKAREASLGKAQTFEMSRTKMLDFWHKQGVKDAEIFRTLNVRGPDDITVDDLILMRGHANAFKDGSETLAQIFPPAEPTPEQAKATINEALKARKASAAASPPISPPVTQEPPAEANAGTEPPFDMKG